MVVARRLLMAIDQEMERRDLTKADLAAMIGLNPASIRRLFTSERANPTLRTVLTLMAALRIDLEVKVHAAAVTVQAAEQTPKAEVELRPQPRRRRRLDLGACAAE